MWTCDADGKEIHLALAYGIRTRFFASSRRQQRNAVLTTLSSFVLRLKIHFRWRRGREQVARGRPHYHVSIGLQMRNRFSINLLPRRPALKVDHRERWINFRFSLTRCGLITTSCCAAFVPRKKEEKSIISFSSHRLTGSRREASENETFSGSGPNFAAAIFHPQTFSGKSAADFVSSPSLSQREIRLAAARHPRSAFMCSVWSFKNFCCCGWHELCFSSKVQIPSHLERAMQWLSTPSELIISCPKVTFLPNQTCRLCKADGSI